MGLNLSPMVDARIGPFTLGQPLGEGTYGEVWEGRHRRSGVRVAIKFLPWQGAEDPGLRRALEREARLLATLDHPHVLRLLDFGRVGRRESRELGGRWPHGTPYLVLEYVGGGTCSALRGRLPWAGVRDVLFRVLDALAHAHARGVIHLDLKPANILLGGRVVGAEASDGVDDPVGLVSGLRLADFGIAGLFGRGQHRRSSVGTPAYMAPEQFRQAWRDFGPWTDLYAVGCTAWAMLTGRAPFHPKRGKALAMAHAYEDPPLFEPRIGVPEGLEAWLRALLAKDPARRPARCAEAAMDLASLGDAAPGGAADPNSVGPDTPTLRGSEQPTQLESEWGGPVPELSLSPSPTATLAAENLGTVNTWRRPEPPPTPLKVADAGLGVIGLRVPRLVGREADQDALWRTLLQVRREGAPRAVVLRGPGGRGVSRLARWLQHRSHELGIADTIRAAHDPDEPDALGRALRDWLRGWDLDRLALELRIHRQLRRWGHDKPWLATLASTVLVQEQTAARPRDVQSVLAELVGAASDKRTAVLVLDEAQWGPEGLGLALALLAAPQARVLVIAAVQDDEEPHAQAVQALEDLVGHPRSTVREISPLREPDARRLVEDSLLLEPLLAARAVGLSGGSPRFLLQLVQDWVQRDQLAPTAEGFVLREPDATALPGDMAALLLRRLDPVELGDPGPLELAAALGARVDREEWLALAPQGEPIATRAVAAGLWEPTRAGWRFQVGVVREVLAERARAAGRWADHHERCVRLLQARPGAGLRLGRHLLAAGDAGRAFELLYEEAQRARLFGRGQDALQLADQTAQALALLQPAADDERLGQQLLLECRLLWDLGDVDTLRLRADRMLDQARTHGWRVLEGEALRCRALARRARRDPTCETDFHGALAVFVAVEDSWRASRVQGDLCNLYCVLGRADDAEPLGSLAVQGARRLGDREGLAMALLARSLARERQGRLEEALADAVAGRAVTTTEGVPLWEINGLRRTSEVLVELGRANEARAQLLELVDGLRLQLNLGALGSVLNRLGDLERAQGRRDAAERCYREVVDMGRLVGHSRHFARLNLGLLLLQSGRAAPVVGLASPVASHAAEIGHHLLEACARSLLCWAHAVLGDAEGFESGLVQVEDAVARFGLPDLDLAIAMEQAGRQAAIQLGPELAARALAVAASTYERRGDRAAAEGCVSDL